MGNRIGARPVQKAASPFHKRSRPCASRSAKSWAPKGWISALSCGEAMEILSSVILFPAMLRLSFAQRPEFHNFGLLRLNPQPSRLKAMTGYLMFKRVLSLAVAG